ncbi:MAG: hypothetical protein JNM68_00645, partial [Dinghuibacter sp.]|nr:hypothetical protein [Dinghuibacter sp.]
MKKLLFSCAAVWAFSFSTHAQHPGYEELARNLFNAFRYNDTAAFMRSFISNKEANRLMYHYIRLNKIKDTGNYAQVEMPDMQAMLKREYIHARKLFADSGVQWADATFTDTYYNVLKDRNSVYPSALGEILFRSGGKYFSIVLSDAVFINDSWKLVSFRPARGAAPEPSMVAYFTEQDELFLLYGLGPSAP